ncbi:MAG: NmrA family NAD(P)-binding protein [Gammaproteobacteria bacterium]|nr:NmrA family NAD(P)-binding protein [Gammaproteobacteria bacterium]MCF6258589.1 NmrA family NAD(P)-binding protein [Gammaproteobacteria bacterium]
MIKNQIDKKLPLIIGSSGKTGMRVAERFDSNGKNYRAGTRHSEIPFDWYDTNTWQKALHGINSVYMVFSPDLAVPGAPAIIKTFVNVAKICGVKHLVLLSGRGEVEAQDCEKIVMDSALDWTIVRSSWFAQNFSESFFLDDIVRGQVFLPIGEIKEPFVDIEDLADIVFAALTDKKHKGQIYEVTGSKLLTFREVFTEIETATGRRIDYQQISMDDYVKFMSEASVPQDYIALIKYLFTEVLDGRNASLTDGIQRALGRGPRSFHEYAKATAETGVWDNPAQANVSA